jgi:hypothetical protein
MTRCEKWNTGEQPVIIIMPTTSSVTGGVAQTNDGIIRLPGLRISIKAGFIRTHGRKSFSYEQLLS